RVRGMNRLQFSPSLQSFSQSPQVSKAINSSTVSVAPSRLQCVAAYEVKADELKTRIRICYLRSRNIAEHVGFATTSCARTRTSQHFYLEKRFRPVIPGYSKLISYLLNVCKFEAHQSFRRLGRSPKIAVP